MMRFPMYIKAENLKRNDKIGKRIVSFCYCTERITGVQFWNGDMKFFSWKEKVFIWR